MFSFQNYKPQPSYASSWHKMKSNTIFQYLKPRTVLVVSTQKVTYCMLKKSKQMCITPKGDVRIVWFT